MLTPIVIRLPFLVSSCTSILALLSNVYTVKSPVERMIYTRNVMFMTLYKHLQYLSLSPEQVLSQNNSHGHKVIVIILVIFF